MKRQLILVAFTLLGLRAVAEPLVTLSSSSALTATTAVRHKVYHGETVRLAHTFLARSGEAVDLTGCTADFYYQTPGMGATEWYKAAATVSGETVSVDWHAGMDPGGASVRYFFAISRDGGKLYRANGLLTLLDSPGFTPAVLEPADIRAEVAAEILAELRATDLADLQEQIKAEEARATEVETAIHNAQAQEVIARTQADSALQNTKQDKLIAGENIAIAADGKTIGVTPNTFVKLGTTNDMGGSLDAAIHLINRNYGGNVHYPIFRLGSQARVDRWIADVFYNAIEFTTTPGVKTRLGFERGAQDSIVRKEEMDTALSGKADTSHSHAWSAITSKPSTFAPAAHTHTIAEVAGLQTAINGKADTSHSHAWTEITNKPSTFAPAAHTHTIAEVADLQTAINGKADTSHSHALEDTPVSINGVPHIITWDTVTETFILTPRN